MSTNPNFNLHILLPLQKATLIKMPSVPAFEKNYCAILRMKQCNVDVPWGDEYERMISGMKYAANPNLYRFVLPLHMLIRRQASKLPNPPQCKSTKSELAND